MISIAPDSEVYLNSGKPFDPDLEGSSFLEVFRDIVRAPVDLATGNRDTRLFSAADKAQQLGGQVNSRAISERLVYDDIIRRVREASGVTLDNPSLAPPPTERERRRMNRDGMLPQDRQNNAIAAFMDRVRELQQQYPDALGDLDVDTPPAEQAANRRFEAEQTANRLWQNAQGNVALNWTTSMAGSIWASRTDPLFWLSLPLGGTGTGATWAARVGNAAAKNAAINAGVQTVGEPFIQQQRAEADLPSGLGHAVADVALAGLVGGLFGGGIQGAAEFARLRQIARTVHVSEDERLAMQGAKRAGDTIDETMKPPPGVSRETAARTYPDALAHVDEPLEPPPLGEPAGAYDDLYNWGLQERARQAMDDAESLDDAILMFRADPDLVDGAQLHPDPDVRMVGRLARLSDDALMMVRNGDVDPVMGSAVGAMADAPEHQSALMRLIAEQRPRDVDEARVMIRDWQAAESAVRANQRLAGAADSGRVEPPPAGLEIEPGSLRNSVPVMRDDGTVTFATRADAAMAADRPKMLADLVRNCDL